MLVASFQFDYAADPAGRAVLVHLDQDLNVSAPFDRFRFDVNATRPLVRDGSAAVADITGDGKADLIVSDFDGAVTLYPGQPGKAAQFGRGNYLRYATTTPAEDPFYSEDNDAYWTSGDARDLDGNGSQELIIGRHVFSITGSLSQLKLTKQYTFTTSTPFDAAASIGDLNGDSKPDVVITTNYGARATSVFWNTSAPGAISFSAEQVLHNWDRSSWEQAESNNHVSLGDLNGDGLLDLAGPTGIYFNTGSATTPAFNFAVATMWNKVGGPDFLSLSDQPPRIYLRDANGDGKLDAFFSNPGTTLHQVVYFQNTGTAQAHQLTYRGPVTVAGTPASLVRFGQATPSFGGNVGTIATVDFDGNGESEIAAISRNSDRRTTLWGVVGAGGDTEFALQDRYTDPLLPQVSSAPSDVLFEPPALAGAWVDANNDGLADLFGFADTSINAQADLMLYLRSGAMPFSLGEGIPVKTNSDAQIKVAGVCLVDVDQDSHLDLVSGDPSGQLLYYRNTATDGTYLFADPLPLTDASSNPISAVDNSWPTAIDLNGDGNLDFLVGGQDGHIRRVLCQTPGSASGYVMDGLLGTPEQSPVEVGHVVSGGDATPTLATADVDHNGLIDAVMGDARGRVWLLRNVGTAATASFSLEALQITRTAAANMETVDGRTLRLYFAIPVSQDANISFHNVPTTAGPISGTARLNHAPALNAAPSPVLNSMPEDGTNPPGTLTYNFAFTAITDVDAGAEKGIAITAASTTYGHWQYSLNNGASWIEMTANGPITGSAALLLPVNGQTRVRFLPNANFNGNVQLWYCAWDRTHGAIGSRLAVSGNQGGAKSLSWAIEHATLTVAPVNDKPVLTLNGSLGYKRNEPAVVLAPNAAVTDVDSANFGGGSLRVRIAQGGGNNNTLAIGSGFTVDATGNVKQGTLIIGKRLSNGVGTNELKIQFNQNATKSIVQSLVRSITYRNVGGSAGQRKIEFTVSDGDGGLSDVRTKTVNVT